MERESPTKVLNEGSNEILAGKASKEEGQGKAGSIKSHNHLTSVFFSHFSSLKTLQAPSLRLGV
jgi:hypothetical protein